MANVCNVFDPFHAGCWLTLLLASTMSSTAMLDDDTIVTWPPLWWCWNPVYKIESHLADQ